MDGLDIKSADRASTGKLIATGGIDGLVKLFNFPTIKEDAKFNAYPGHSSHITNVRFTTAADAVLSTGGNDKCVMVWEVQER
jgi:microtubule-associated protein-like 6